MKRVNLHSRLGGEDDIMVLGGVVWEGGESEYNKWNKFVSLGKTGEKHLYAFIYLSSNETHVEYL